MRRGKGFLELPLEVPNTECEEWKGEAMGKPEKDDWTTPEFEDLRVSAECTGYAGAEEATRS